MTAFQLAYKKHHSTESALLNIHNDILLNRAKGSVTALTLLGLSAAFDLFVYLQFYVAFNTAQVISQRVVGRAEETSTYSSLGFCTVNCRPTASNYQLSHLRP